MVTTSRTKAKGSQATGIATGGTADITPRKARPTASANATKTAGKRPTTGKRSSAREKLAASRKTAEKNAEEMKRKQEEAEMKKRQEDEKAKAAEEARQVQAWKANKARLAEEAKAAAAAAATAEAADAKETAADPPAETMDEEIVTVEDEDEDEGTNSYVNDVATPTRKGKSPNQFRPEPAAKWFESIRIDGHLPPSESTFVQVKFDIPYGLLATIKAPSKLKKNKSVHLLQGSVVVGVCGRVTKLMRTRVESRLRTVPTRRLASSWCSGLVTHLLELVHAQWALRNDFAHDATEDGAKREETQQLREAVTMEFMEGTDTLLQEFHHLLSGSFDQIWARPVQERRQWLVEVAAARAISEIEPEPPPAAPLPASEANRRSRRRREPPALSGRRRKRS